MLTAEQNEMLTRVGPNTPMGELYRRYWLPVAALSEMDQAATKKVRLLGEDLVLFKDMNGKFGLIEEVCPHRGASLAYGIPEEGSIRCPYHGWCFNGKGECLEQPAEPPQSTFKNRIKISGYPVQELGGLIFTYMGPEPVPLLPRFDVFATDNAYRTIGVTELPVNWLQCMENSFDATHVEWLHGKFSVYANEKTGSNTSVFSKKHIKIGFDLFEYGIIKRRVLEGQTEEADDWKLGHPVLFPHILKIGVQSLYSQFQMRIPIDDENTMIYWYTIYHSPDTIVPEQKTIPFFEVPYKDDQGKMYVDSVEHQDLFVWVTQGRTARRTSEHLGSSDKGVIMYRQVLREEMEKVQRGEDPLGTVREPEINQFIHLPEEARSKYYDGVKKNILLKQATPTYRWLPEPYKKELHSIFDMEKHV